MDDNTLDSVEREEYKVEHPPKKYIAFAVVLTIPNIMFNLFGLDAYNYSAIAARILLIVTEHLILTVIITATLAAVSTLRERYFKRFVVNFYKAYFYSSLVIFTTVLLGAFYFVFTSFLGSS